MCMGFNWHNLKWINNLIKNEYFNFWIRDVSEFRLYSNRFGFFSMFQTKDRLLGFIPHPGWKEYIEIDMEYGIVF